MTTTNDALNRPKPLRLWPGVVLVILQLLARFVVPEVMPEAAPIGVMGALFGGLLVIIWWLFFSRAPWLDRVGAVALMAIALLVSQKLLHESVATGAMGMLYYVYAIPGLCAGFVLWAWVSQKLAPTARRISMAATIFVACGAWTLIRTGGFDGGIDSDFAWRWSQTPEQRLLAESDNELSSTQIPPISATTVHWSGFRGPQRDAIIRGTLFATDWSKAPPTELWCRPIGPGWSSFAVAGDFFYTQEQRGEEETVACYRLSTGDPIWRHADHARFWESNAGAGPRGTPTLHQGLVVSLGATGILNVLNAQDGALQWSRNAADDTGAKLPEWGFSSSPLVVDDIVVVAVSGALTAYDLASGEPHWTGPSGGTSYSSPQLFNITGVAQVLQLHGDGLVAVSADDGAVMWQHDWKGYPIVQPALTTDGDILISVDAESGTRRLAVTQASGEWSVDERWTSLHLKSYFNDFVIHEGHAYGFDGRIMACIDVNDGQRKWKGGRYGNGQLLLFADQDVLLVLSERGDLALVAASADGFSELAKVPAIKGKTWNHPVVANDLLLVRNAHEMAAFRLPLKGDSAVGTQASTLK